MADSNKSILDEVADTANEAFRHALGLIKEGKSAEAHDVATFAKVISEHAREIEDHERIMNERHGVNVSFPANATTLTASPRNSSED